MEIVFLFKPVVDMLYQYQYLDVFLMGICVFSLVSRPIPRLITIDIISILLIVLFAFSFIRNTEGLNQFVKIESGFILYFIGRSHYTEIDRYTRILKIGFIPIIIICLITYFTKTGFVMWGTHKTFRSLYYFKTDLAAAMVQCAIFYLFVFPMNKKLMIIPLLCLFFIVLSNARAYYFIAFILIVFSVLYYVERKERKVFMKINVSLLFFILASIIGVLILLNYIGSVYGTDYLLFNFENTETIYNAENTQGRNLVWEDIYSKFAKQDFFVRMVGIDLNTDKSHLGMNSHNLYLKILYSIGYLGSIVFFYYVISILQIIKGIKKRKHFYIIIMLLISYLLSGMSVISIESTQLTWLFMFYLGCMVSLSNESKHLYANTITHMRSQKM